MHQRRAVQWAWVMVLGAALSLAGCSGGGNSVIGKWSRGNDQIYTFTKDGEMIKQEGAHREVMGYSLAHGNTLYLKPKDRPTSLAFIYSFPSENELVLTPKLPSGTILPPSESEPIRFERVRE